MQQRKGRLSKRTNRKQNFKKFIESNYSDIQLFLNACNNDENLLIYTCLKKEELDEFICKMRERASIDEQLKYLVDNQPTMNENVERFDRCVGSIAKYLRGYIEYNGFKMANSDGDHEDWTSEFWAKYCKICDFYRTRWFFPEQLKKKSTVQYTPMLYKEFIYICRMSITGERKHQAFLATMNQNSSIFKLSLDAKLNTDKNEQKTISEVIPDNKYNGQDLLESSVVSLIISKALNLSKQYAEGKKYFNQIKKFYEIQDPSEFDKKVVILGKIFLYKAGLISPKTVSFIKSLSNTYKSKYNISQAKVNNQMLEFKKQHQKEKAFIPKKRLYNEDYKELLFRKRGEL